jgi:CDP-glucose 4,6-dehydratase
MVTARALSVFRGKRVLVTGDTGFKGSWLCLWLNALGAEVAGYALAPKHADDHFNLLRLGRLIRHTTADIRDYAKLAAVMRRFKPEFVFHLAAQSLVRVSYNEPKPTFDTNVGGSVNVLEAVRNTPSVRALVYVTSDKCYRNNEWVWGYREHDVLGGRDPYSASKAAAEIVFEAYRLSYFAQRGLGAASVRAGNVIGGGDWSEDRIVPDCIRALRSRKSIVLRNPDATRPWQHVLEPLGGYLLLASRLYATPQRYTGAWNFGPASDAAHTVGELAQRIVQNWGSGRITVRRPRNAPHEALLLHLNCDKARLELGWKPAWNFDQTVDETVHWYKNAPGSADVRALGRDQIERYTEAAR